MATRKPDVRSLSPRDRVATVSHLIDTIDHNANHAYNHAKNAATLARGLKGKDENAETIRFNAEHSLKHAKEVKEHAVKLRQHIKKYPGAAAALEELVNPRLSSNASPPNARSRK